jgi:hypothetical protein
MLKRTHGKFKLISIRELLIRSVVLWNIEIDPVNGLVEELDYPPVLRSGKVPDLYAVPVSRVSVFFFRIEFLAGLEMILESRVRNILNRQLTGWIFQVFDLLERKNMLTNGIIDGNGRLRVEKRSTEKQYKR